MTNACRYCGKALLVREVGRGRQKWGFCNERCRAMYWYRKSHPVVTNRERGLRKRVLDGLGEYRSPKLSEAEAAWLAALIDGEGHVCVHRHPKPPGNYVFATVGVSNTFRALIEKVIDVAGVGNAGIRQRPYGKNGKVCYEARFSSVAVSDILRQVRPYLIVKGQQADLVMELQDARDALPVRAGPTERIVEIYRMVRDLNKRGAKCSTI
jgi:hypothetical protein